MRFLSRFAPVVLLAGLVLAANSGCGHSPTSPATSSLSTQAAPVKSGGAPQSSSLISTVGAVVGGVVNLIVRTLDIVGSLGGSLTNGLWRVDVPPGAIDGTATISISIQSLTSARCDLGISPADKNHFATPVTLTFDCSNVPADQLASYQIFWFNPGTGQWEPVAGSTVDLTRKTVSAPLQHFSTYEAAPADGKAGW